MLKKIFGQKRKYEVMSAETGWSTEEIKRGYSFFKTDYGATVVQMIDDLIGTEFQKFESDTQAGEQALKDGHDVYKADECDEELSGWYILKG